MGFDNCNKKVKLFWKTEFLLSSHKTFFGIPNGFAHVTPNQEEHEHNMLKCISFFCKKGKKDYPLIT